MWAKSGFEETSANDQLKWSLNLNHKMWNSISTVTSWVLKWTQYSTFLGSVQEIGWPWVHQESFKLCYQPKRICAIFIQDCSCSCTSLKWYIYRNCWFLNWGSSKYMRWMINKPERERESSLLHPCSGLHQSFKLGGSANKTSPSIYTDLKLFNLTCGQSSAEHQVNHLLLYTISSSSSSSTSYAGLQRHLKSLPIPYRWNKWGSPLEKFMCVYIRCIKSQATNTAS